MDAYEIPVTRPQAARTAEEAVEIARQVGYPVVMKIHSPQITHKTDVGGVRLNLSSDEGVARGLRKNGRAARQKRPDATFSGRNRWKKWLSCPTPSSLSWA